MGVIKQDVRDGDVILFHDIYPTTVEAVERTIPIYWSRVLSLSSR